INHDNWSVSFAFTAHQCSPNIICNQEKTENIKYYESDISCWCQAVGKWRMETMTPRSMELFVTHDHAAKEQADSQLTWLQLEEHPAWLSRGTLLRGSCTL
uniref:Uncharacterized protein n=1 Tax=Aegilops tauschii subsp. strangulata TaxID=200361 RepID=A0A453A0R5_AEGTS